MKRSSPTRQKLRPSSHILRAIAKSQHKTARRKYLIPACLSLLIIATVAAPHLILPASTASSNESDKTTVLQPQNGSNIFGLQTFKLISKLDPDVQHYKAYWKVDEGQLTEMYNSHVDGAHKEAQAEVSGWNWRGQGPYMLTFVTTQNDGTPIDSFAMQIFINPNQTAASSSSVIAAVSSVSSSVTSSSVSSGNALIGNASASAVTSVLNVVYPVEGAVLSRSQTHTLRASISDLSPQQYFVKWKVDGGAENDMTNDGSEKVADINVSGWNWNTGQYVFTFIARDFSGNILSHATRKVWIGAGGAPASSAVLSSAPPIQIVLSSSASSSAVATNGTMRIVSPTPNQRMFGTQTFSAFVEGISIGSYTMTWAVDGGQPVPMSRSGDRMTASVDPSSWGWKGEGPYGITFRAMQNKKVISQGTVNMFVGAGGTSSSQAASVASSTVSTLTPVPAYSSNNPLSGMRFFIDPNSDARRTADSWRSSRPEDARQMDEIAAMPSAAWFGNWNSNVQSAVSSVVSTHSNAGAIPVLVAYNIPGRDCGNYSSGGAGNAEEYKRWIRDFASGIGSRNAVVILEPDGLALECGLTEKQELIAYAVSTFKANANTRVYVDAGHASWHPADTMASRMSKAGIQNADGISLNVSNYYTVSENASYGSAILGKIGGNKGMVIDVSRSGNGSNNGAWCNDFSAAMGPFPTTNPGIAGVHALLGIKRVGESDGNCNGGPAAGQWWADYALAVARNTNR